MKMKKNKPRPRPIKYATKHTDAHLSTTCTFSSCKWLRIVRSYVQYVIEVGRGGGVESVTLKI